MTLHEQVTDILASAVEAQECAGISVLVRRCGEEMLYTQAGMSDVASGAADPPRQHLPPVQPVQADYGRRRDAAGGARAD